MHRIFRINGTDHALTIDPRDTLLDLLRDRLHLTGTKKGCDHGQCGACTVLSDGKRILSCLQLAATQTGEVTTMEIQCADTEFLVLGFEPLPELPLAEALDEQRCPIPGLVRQISDLIESLRSAALYRFVREALLHPDALLHFWISPASRRDHHAYPGGLAEHSLEVATMVASASGLPKDDREIGIVFALLHDYGKLWCYGPEAPRRNSQAHEQMGYEALLPALDRLIEAEAARGAARIDPRHGQAPSPRSEVERRRRASSQASRSATS